MQERSRRTAWLRGVAVLAALLVAALAVGTFLLSRADGPVGILAGPERASGGPVYVMKRVLWTARPSGSVGRGSAWIGRGVHRTR